MSGHFSILYMKGYFQQSENFQDYFQEIKAE